MDVLRKFNAMADKLFEAKYVLQDKQLYQLFLDDINNLMENTLKRYMALQLLFMR